ncbi:MAG: hypothetical protein KDA95_05010 [Acidimicrobiales bacterium]|nr:hypothetical protein [Acidimicrobiales bacterium]
MSGDFDLGPNTWIAKDSPKGPNKAATWVVAGLVALVAITWIVSSFSGSDEPGQASTGGGQESKSDCESYSLGANTFNPPESVSQPGVHVWHDVDGFHLRWVQGSGSPTELRGTISSEGGPVKLIEPTDGKGASEGEGKINFDMTSGLSELRFKVECSTKSVTFSLTDNGGPIEPAQVRVGPESKPTEMPFTLTRGE